MGCNNSNLELKRERMSKIMETDRVEYFTVDLRSPSPGNNNKHWGCVTITIYDIDRDFYCSLTSQFKNYRFGITEKCKVKIAEMKKLDSIGIGKCLGDLYDISIKSTDGSSYTFITDTPYEIVKR